MPMNPSNCSPGIVREIFQALLTNKNVPTTTDQRTSTNTTTTTTTPTLLTAPPPKNSIRFIENDQNNRREKYDGYRWRLVCTWNNECQNLAASVQLCCKHNAIRRNKAPYIRKKKQLATHSSLPIMSPYNRNHARHNNKYGVAATADNDEDDIEILEDHCTGPKIRHSVNSNIKSETPDFHVFSVEHVDEADIYHNIKSEPRASSSHRSNKPATNDIEYLTSKTRSNGLNITELISKNLPPLTDFEEEFLAVRLMQKFPTTCLMLDAQLFLHDEAIAVVKQNYRLKMDTVAPEYFYDFLLRHPRVALHYSNWFTRCKPVPPSTGCPIDTKVWTLSMIVRGATTTDHMDDD